MRIFDVRHQSRAHRLLQRALDQDRLPHAYIFHGPDGVGKEALAIRLAKLLLCESPVTVAPQDVPEDIGLSGGARDACGRCRSCHLVDVGSHPDLHLIYRQLNAHHPDSTVRNRKALELGVDVIRHFVIDSVALKPACGHGKVFLIREADRITPAAQNALLKTLEEPPPTTFIVLLASSLDRLLSTTRSRCQLVSFAPLPVDFVAEMVQSLSEAEFDQDTARLYAALAQGSLGTALRLAEDDLASFNRELVEGLAGLVRSNATDLAKRLLEYAKQNSDRQVQRDKELSDTAAQRQAFGTVLVLLATWYRDLLHVLSGTGELVANRASMPLLRSQADRLTPVAAARAVALVVEAERQLDLNVNVQLCVESLTFRLAALHEQPDAALLV